MVKQYDISIADVSIRLIYTGIFHVDMFAAEAFFVKTVNPDIVLNIEIVDVINKIPFPHVDVKTSVWEMCNKDGFRMFNFFEENVVIATLGVSSDFSKGEIKVLKHSLHDVIPPISVMVPILSGFLLKNNIGFLFHGALIAIDGEGIILTGKSGAGKSTLSELFKKNGYKKIGDDRLILTKDRQTGVVLCHSTPFDFKLTNWVNEKIKLKAIVCLEHSNDNQNNFCSLNMSNNIMLLALSNFVPLFETESMDKHFQLYKNILDNILLYRYAFVPNNTSVRYLSEILNNS